MSEFDILTSLLPFSCRSGGSGALIGVSGNVHNWVAHEEFTLGGPIATLGAQLTSRV